jgi:GNAT superfamily N-acetyltransferase
MIVRDLRLADAPAARRLLGQLGYEVAEGEIRERLASLAKAPDHRVVVAEIDGEVAGLLHVFERPALEKACEAVVQALVVEAGRRGSGVGRTLMNEAQAWARARGLASIVLYSRVDRHDARAFYEQLGYRRAATSHLMRRDDWLLSVRSGRGRCRG